MRGHAKIVNSQADAQVAKLTREQIINVATIVVRHDDANYPDNYDQNLKEGEAGYVEPMWRFEEEIDQSVLDRFGITI